MSLADLQSVIDASIAKANPFTRQIFESDQWDAARVQDFANADGSMTVATVRTPHAAIVIAGCADGTFYFTASPRSALLGNLRRQPDVAFTLGDKVMGRGRAEAVGRPADIKHLAPELSRTLRMMIDGDWGVYIYALHPSRVFAQES